MRRLALLLLLGLAAASPAAAEGQRYEQPYYGDEQYLQSYREVVRWYNPALEDAQVEEIVLSLLHYAHQQRLDPRLLVAMVAVESGFRPDAVSRAGAVGLGQIMPETAREIGVEPRVPYQNLEGMARIMRRHLDRYAHKPAEVRLRWALAAYNAGPGAVEAHGGVPPYRETRSYVERVLREWRLLSGQGR